MTTPKSCNRYTMLQDLRLAEEELLSPEEEAFLVEHAAQCPSCGLEAATLSALRHDEGLAPDPGLTDAVIQRRVNGIMAARSEPPRATRSRRPWHIGLAASAAAAAAATLAVLFIGQPWKGDKGTTGGATAQRDRPGRLTLVSGDVSTGRRAATVNQRLTAGERLRVGSGRAVLSLADGSTVTLEKRSQLEIISDRRDRVDLRLHQGEAIFQVAPQPSGRRFDVSAAWGTVRVVGTVFKVSHARSERVLVARGKVRVKMSNAPAISLTGGRMVLASRQVREIPRRTRQSLLRSADAAGRLVAKDPAILAIQTRSPGASVALDGAVVGTTPIELCLSPGAHLVTVSRPGCVPMRRTVELAVGKRSSLRVALIALASTAGDPTAGQPKQPPTTPSVATAGAGRPGARSSTPSTPWAPKAETPVPELEAPTTGQLLRHAAIHRASANWRGVVKVYRQLIRLHPKSPEAASSLVLVGQVLLRHLGQPQAALRYFNAYLKRHRGGAIAQEADWGRVICLRRLGRRRDEIQACRDLLKRHPRSVYASRVRARLAALKAGAK